LLFLNRTKKTRFRFAKKNWFLLVFVLIALISVFVSSATKISIFRWLKLIEFIILYIYLRKSKEFLGLNSVLSVIFYSGVFQAVLAIVQFIKQGSIGIKFIEAGVFDPNSSGVANFILGGDRILRSYGSFPHPNVLAGFLLLAIFCGYEIYIRRSNLRREVRSLTLLFFVVCFLVIIMGLFLTFSRTAITVFGAISLLMFLIEFFKLRKLEHTEQRLKDGKNLIKLFVLVLVSCLLVVAVLFPYIKARFFTISLQEQAVDLRFFYNEMAVQMIKEKPVLGIGIGNFVHYSQNYPVFMRAATKIAGENQNEIPDWIYQPVHNIYLLIASEIGILGLLMLLGFVAIILFKGNLIFVSLFFCFLIISLTDHYFWTLQQGAIMFWLGLALIFPKKIK
ncbi:MAG: O-antigen ligase family protein, partial [Candidatus Portnoybacteria bacterium]|nr:O-antigen ligase family protein [Candidatus Portnoybacteria bacterium]